MRLKNADNTDFGIVTITMNVNETILSLRTCKEKREFVKD